MWRQGQEELPDGRTARVELFSEPLSSGMGEVQAWGVSECLGDPTKSLEGPAISGVKVARSLSGASLQLRASERSLAQPPGQGGVRNGGDGTP